MNLKIAKPTFLVNEIICRKNIHEMAEKARKSCIDFRPHFKTHQSAEIGSWYRDEGIDKITVSSVSMAEYFSNHGWSDITIAFPYNPLESIQIERLAKKIKLNIQIESKESLDHLNKNVQEKVTYFIKIDVGTGRTGIPESRFSEIPNLCNSENKKHTFKGFLFHAGHSYKSLNKNDAQIIYDESIIIAEKATSVAGKKVFLSYGDTPTCSLLNSFKGIDEIRPGNFAFYDYMQFKFGSCRLEDIAVCLVCPVVAIHEDRNEAIIYGGSVHFSKDSVGYSEGQFGLVVDLYKNEWKPTPVGSLKKLSQEHGTVVGTKQYISSLKIGDLIYVLPVHSCLTANLQQSYLTLSGKVISKFN